MEIIFFLFSTVIFHCHPQACHLRLARAQPCLHLLHQRSLHLPLRCQQCHLLAQQLSLPSMQERFLPCLLLLLIHQRCLLAHRHPPPPFPGCFLAMSAANTNNDRQLNKKQCLKFVNALATGAFDSLSFSQLPQPLRQSRFARRGQGKNQINAFGSAAGEATDSDQVASPEVACKETREEVEAFAMPVISPLHSPTMAAPAATAPPPAPAQAPTASPAGTAMMPAGAAMSPVAGAGPLAAMPPAAAGLGPAIAPAMAAGPAAPPASSHVTALRVMAAMLLSISGAAALHLHNG